VRPAPATRAPEFLYVAGVGLLRRFLVWGATMFTQVTQTICKRCGRAMRSVAEIAPLNGHPGLRAFACGGCGNTQSVMLQPDNALWQDGASSKEPAHSRA
jgi:hypothetical protein